MKRYNIESEQVSSVCWIEKRKCKNGEWVKYSDHEAERKELYETIDNNSKKIIKLTEQKKEMLEVLKLYIEELEDYNQWKDMVEETANLIEKIEGDK